MLCGAAFIFAVFWCRSTTSEQMVADLKRDPHTPFSVLKKQELKFDLLRPVCKNKTYRSKKFEINLFWRALRA